MKYSGVLLFLSCCCAASLFFIDDYDTGLVAIGLNVVFICFACVCASIEDLNDD